MSDIIRSGKDREPRWRWRRWQLAAAAAGIAVAVAAAFIWYLPGVRHHGARTTPGAVGPSPVALGARGSPAAAPSPLPTRPARMTGRPLLRAASLWLLLAGHSPAWLSVPAGRAEPVRGLPQSGNGYQFFRIPGGWAAQPFPVGDVWCGDNCATGPLPVYFLADGSPVASRVGAADFTAAATGGALWLVSYRRGADMSTAAGNAQEVSVTGAALGPPLRLPAGYVIDQGTHAGLLLVQAVAGSSPVRYELWDPGTRRVTRSFEDPIAAGPAEIAWMPSCTASCRVHVLDLPGGHVQEISLPRRSTAYGGAFSADGRLLALQVTAGVTAAGRAAATRLMVATVASGQVTAVPGTTVGSGNQVTFGWQAGGHRLIADVAVGTADQPLWQIAVWQPGDAQPSTALAQTPKETWPVIDQGPY